MDAVDIKQYIIENDRIRDILEGLECHKIKEYPTEYRAALPDSNNATAIQVKKDSLKTKVYKSDENVKGDIITLVMFILDLKFLSALKELHHMLGLKFEKFTPQKTEKKNDPLAIFKNVKSKSADCDMELKLYGDDVLEPYRNLPHILFVKEAISPQTQVKFRIGYCPHQKRITIPHRYYNGGENDFVGIIGRTVIENYDLFDIAKYFPLKKFPKGLNIYGLQENYKQIQETGMVVVMESEKSVLKSDTFGHNNIVAIGSHEITPEQERILIGLNVEIVIGFDKGIGLDFIEKTCKRFALHRKVSYIWDKYDLLGEKDSPVDKGLKRYLYLLKHRVGFN